MSEKLPPEFIHCVIANVIATVISAVALTVVFVFEAYKPYAIYLAIFALIIDLSQRFLAKGNPKAWLLAKSSGISPLIILFLVVYFVYFNK